MDNVGCARKALAKNADGLRLSPHLAVGHGVGGESYHCENNEVDSVHTGSSEIESGSANNG